MLYTINCLVLAGVYRYCVLCGLQGLDILLLCLVSQFSRTTQYWAPWVEPLSSRKCGVRKSVGADAKWNLEAGKGIERDAAGS